MPLILGGFFIIYFLIITPMLWNIPLKMYPIYYPDVWTVMVIGALAGAVGIVVRLVVNLGARIEAA